MLELLFTDLCRTFWAGCKFCFVLFIMLLPFILVALIESPTTSALLNSGAKWNW